MLVLEKSPGSSLDPSADPGDHLTTRVGFDLTKPLNNKGKDFHKAAFPQVDVGLFLKDHKG
jgi:3-polyprenyl-4-hydroxybenzoate decarboxylase